MRKKIFMFALLAVFSASLLSAKVSLVLDVGPLFTHFSNHLSLNNGNKRSFSSNLGGLNVVLRGEFAKNFGVYGMANFAFGTTYWYGKRSTNHWLFERGAADIVYAIDSQFGFFYGFKPVKNLEIMLGFGLGLGGNGWNIPLPGNSEQKTHCTNIGAGFNLDVSYMLTKMIGLYGGISDTMYAPVAVNRRKNISGKKTEETYTGSKVQSAGIGQFSNSLSLKAGIQIKF